MADNTIIHDNIVFKNVDLTNCYSAVGGKLKPALINAASDIPKDAPEQVWDNLYLVDAAFINWNELELNGQPIKHTSDLVKILVQLIKDVESLKGDVKHKLTLDLHNVELYYDNGNIINNGDEVLNNQSLVIKAKGINRYLTPNTLNIDGKNIEKSSIDAGYNIFRIDNIVKSLNISANGVYVPANSIKLDATSKKFDSDGEATIKYEILPKNATDAELLKSATTNYVINIRKNNVPNDNSGIISIKPNSYKSDESITVSINNNGHAIQESIKLISNIIPELSIVASSNNVSVGQSVTVTATANPLYKNKNIKFEWYKDDQVIPNENKNKYTFTCNSEGVIRIACAIIENETTIKSTSHIEINVKPDTSTIKLPCFFGLADSITTEMEQNPELMAQHILTLKDKYLKSKDMAVALSGNSSIKPTPENTFNFKTKSSKGYLAIIVPEKWYVDNGCMFDTTYTNPLLNTQHKVQVNIEGLGNVSYCVSILTQEWVYDDIDMKLKNA